MSKPYIFLFLPDYYAGLLLAFVGGFYAVLGYFKLQGLVTSSVTGHVIVLGAASEIYEHVAFRSRACVWAFFLLAGFISSLIAIFLRTKLKWSPRPVALVLFSIELIFVTIALAVSIIKSEHLDATTHADDHDVMLVGSLMGYAMGAHSVAAKDSIKDCPPTTMMTSTTTGISMTFASYLCHLIDYHTYMPVNQSEAEAQEQMERSSSVVAASREKFLTALRPLVFFLTGAVVSSFVTSAASYWAAAVVVGIVFYLILEIAIKEILEVRKAKEAAEAEAKVAAAAKAAETADTSTPSSADTDAASETLSQKGIEMVA